MARFIRLNTNDSEFLINAEHIITIEKIQNPGVHKTLLRVGSEKTPEIEVKESFEEILHILVNLGLK